MQGLLERCTSINRYQSPSHAPVIPQAARWSHIYLPSEYSTWWRGLSPQLLWTKQYLSFSVIYQTRWVTTCLPPTSKNCFYYLFSLSMWDVSRGKWPWIPRRFWVESILREKKLNYYLGILWTRNIPVIQSISSDSNVLPWSNQIFIEEVVESRI